MRVEESLLEAYLQQSFPNVQAEVQIYLDCYADMPTEKPAAHATHSYQAEHPLWLRGVFEGQLVKVS